MENDKQIPFAPYHAINQFMVDEYRQQVVQAVFNGFESLPGSLRGMLNGLIRKFVSVPGFRNSALAPLAVKVRGSLSAFERSPEFCMRFLSAWSELQPDLRQKVADMLTARGWEIPPADVDRSLLPGFIAVWKSGENYDTLDKAFDEMYPGNTFSKDDLRLMVVWVSNRLPFDQQD